MADIKKALAHPFEYAKALLKWLCAATIIGLCCGTVGSLFHLCIEAATELRQEKEWLIFLLPLGGVLIAFLYGVTKKYGKINTDRVIEAVSRDEKVPLIMMPLIFLSTALTHLLGGSAGREGAALQLGGSLGYNVARLFRMNKSSIKVVVMAGMSGLFSALFGTPLTAAIFAVEVITVGAVHSGAIVPCLISSFSAVCVSKFVFGIEPVVYETVLCNLSENFMILRVIALAVLCALVCILFSQSIRYGEKLMKKYIPNVYLKALVGGAAVVLLTVLLWTTDYNGAGMHIIERALSGTVRPEAFLLKILFTAITLGAGFKGGEIVPCFFVGSTFGCLIGPLLGIDPEIAAAIGMVSLFCGTTNCFMASVVLAVELFGGRSPIAFAVACGICFLMSGNFGLYKSQKILYSRLNDERLDVFAK